MPSNPTAEFQSPHARCALHGHYQNQAIARLLPHNTLLEQKRTPPNDLQQSAPRRCKQDAKMDHHSQRSTKATQYRSPLPTSTVPPRARAAAGELPEEVTVPVSNPKPHWQVHYMGWGNPTHPRIPISNTPTMPLPTPTTICPPCLLARRHGWNHTMDTSSANQQTSPRTMTTSPSTTSLMMSTILKRRTLTNLPKVVIVLLAISPTDRPAHGIPPLQQDQAQSHFQSTVYR
jgi:hypothetical protein